MKAHFKGVPRGCGSVALTRPCASMNPSYPALFYCKWAAADRESEVTVGPLRAGSSKEVDADGQVLGHEVTATCPLPSAASFRDAIHPDAAVGEARSLTLSVAHGLDAATARKLPWEGLPGGNVVHAMLTGEDGADAVLSVVNASGVGSSTSASWVSIKTQRSASGEVVMDQIYSSAAIDVASLKVGGSAQVSGKLGIGAEPTAESATLAVEGSASVTSDLVSSSGVDWRNCAADGPCGSNEGAKDGAVMAASARQGVAQNRHDTYGLLELQQDGGYLEWTVSAVSLRRLSVATQAMNQWVIKDRTGGPRATTYLYLYHLAHRIQCPPMCLL